MVRKLQSKMNEETEHKFNLVRVIKAHLLPITNVAFNKLSTLFATGEDFMLKDRGVYWIFGLLSAIWFTCKINILISNKRPTLKDIEFFYP